MEGKYIVGLCSIEGGGALTHKHFQMMIKGNFTIHAVLSKKIKVCLGWDVSPLMGCAISCKKSRDEGLHTFLGMMGHCMKDNDKEHFEFVHYNVSADDMNNGKMEYVKFGRLV